MEPSALKNRDTGGLDPFSRFAARNKDRLNGLSDGIFAFAMTFLMVEVKVPDAATQAEFLHQLIGMGPRFATWGMSLLSLGIFWNIQQTQINYMEETNAKMNWLHLFYLSLITIIPFSTEVLADYPNWFISLAIFWGNIFLCGFFSLLIIEYSMEWKLFKQDVTISFVHMLSRRIVIGQLFYLAGLIVGYGFDVKWGIMFILFVQLHYVFGNKLPYLRQL